MIMMMMMMMTMMTYTIPYRRTKTHIWDKVLMGIWVHPTMTVMTMTMTMMVIVMVTPLDNHLDQGPLPGPPVRRRDGGRSRPVCHCLGDHRRQQVGQWSNQDLQVTIFLRNMFLVTNICR